MYIEHMYIPNVDGILCEEVTRTKWLSWLVCIDGHNWIRGGR